MNIRMNGIKKKKEPPPCPELLCTANPKKTGDGVIADLLFIWHCDQKKAKKKTSNHITVISDLLSIWHFCACRSFFCTSSQKQN
jgi:hypothetical protein